MKCRFGFVSNSSSSSFVAVGFKLLYDVSQDERDMFEEAGLDVLNGYEDGVKDGESVVCEMIASGDEYMESNEISFSSFERVKKMMEEKYKGREMKIFTGTRMC